MMINTLLRSVYKNLTIFLLFPFYDVKKFKGKYYENGSVLGWVWCWKNLFNQKFLRNNSHISFPVSSRNVFGKEENLIFDMDDLNNFQHFGCYFQCWNSKIILGKGTYIAPNVGIITQNHDIHNLDIHSDAKDVVLGEKCWIGMNSVILPGVSLGDNTIVGAGSVVTKSFSEGNCVIVGSPAKIIRRF